MDGLQISVLGQKYWTNWKRFYSRSLRLLLRLQTTLGKSMDFSNHATRKNLVFVVLCHSHVLDYSCSNFPVRLHDASVQRRAKVLQALAKMYNVQRFKILRRRRIWVKAHAPTLSRHYVECVYDRRGKLLGFR